MEDCFIMKFRHMLLIVLAMSLLVPCASGESGGSSPAEIADVSLTHRLDSLPMDSTAIAPVPMDDYYLSDRDYEDSTISVHITEGTYERVHYMCARVKISHPSQLRTTPARQVNYPDAVFSAWDTSCAECIDMAAAVHAVVAINGDFCTDPDRCCVMMRQGLQLRNMCNGRFDVLVIDNDGKLDCLQNCYTQDYKNYYEEHNGEIYQAFCFGPCLVKNNAVIVEDKKNSNSYTLYDVPTQRMAIAQVGNLDYLLITCDGDARLNKTGLTIAQFADLCLQLSREANPVTGARIVYNLDGGNSSSLVFKTRDNGGRLSYAKLNMPKLSRPLADMICFVTLEALNDEPAE